MDWQRDLPYWPHNDWSRRVLCAPHRWHVQEYGSGPTILFLHGAGASTHSWNAMMTALATDHHVVALDLPGHGFTVSGGSGRSSLPAMSEDIAALCKQQGWLPDQIVGHSAGAAIALHLAEKHLISERCKPRILAINPAFSDFSGLAGVFFPLLAKSLAINPMTPWLFSLGPDPLARARRLIASTGSTVLPEQLAIYARLLKDRAHIKGALNMMAHWSLAEFGNLLQSAETPMTIAVGLNDQAVPPNQTARLKESLLKSRLIEFPDLGHLAHEEKPDLFATLLTG